MDDLFRNRVFISGVILMSKEQYIIAHEAEILEYLERNPQATEEEAYDKTADRAYARMVDTMADLADTLRKRKQEQT